MGKILLWHHLHHHHHLNPKVENLFIWGRKIMHAQSAYESWIIRAACHKLLFVWSVYSDCWSLTCLWGYENSFGTPSHKCHFNQSPAYMDSRALCVLNKCKEISLYNVYSQRSVSFCFMVANGLSQFVYRTLFCIKLKDRFAFAIHRQYLGYDQKSNMR